jgi:hypothetical protein
MANRIYDLYDDWFMGSFGGRLSDRTKKRLPIARGTPD